MNRFFEKLSLLNFKPNSANAKIPPASSWFAKVESEKLRKNYIHEIESFIRFANIKKLKEFKTVKPAHLSLYVQDLKSKNMDLHKIKYKISVISTLFEDFKNQNAISSNPCKELHNLNMTSNANTEIAFLSNKQAELLLCAPSTDVLEGIRDRAILATLLYHPVTAEEVSRIRIKDIRQKQGIPHFRLVDSSRNVKYIPIHPSTLKLLYIYRAYDLRIEKDESPLFRQINNSPKLTDQALNQAQINQILRTYAIRVGLLNDSFALGINTVRAVNARQAAEKATDIKDIKKRLGSRHVGVFKMYDARLPNPKDGPVFRIVL